MNIHQHEKQIQNLLQEGTRVGKNGKKRKQYYPGVYLISRTLKNNLIKLGESSNLFERIKKQYKVCFPLRDKEFFLRYIVICPREKDGKKTYAQIMEKELLKIIDSEVYDSYSKEYLFHPDINEMEKRMFKVLKSHSKYFTRAIKFTQVGFRIFNGESFKHLQSFETLPSLNNDVNLLLNISKPVKKKRLMIKYNLPRKEKS